jgi:hypothetical protein
LRSLQCFGTSWRPPPQTFEPATLGPHLGTLRLLVCR